MVQEAVAKAEARVAARVTAKVEAKEPASPQRSPRKHPTFRHASRRRRRQRARFPACERRTQELFLNITDKFGPKVQPPRDLASAVAMIALLHVIALQSADGAYHLGHIRTRPCPRHKALDMLIRSASSVLRRHVKWNSPYHWSKYSCNDGPGRGPGAVDPMFEWLHVQRRSAAKYD